MGNFDGLHRGHALLLGQAKHLALARGRPLAVLTFEPHPRSVLRPGSEPFRLTPFRAKERELAKHGVDLLFVQHFDLGFAFLPEHTGKGYAYEASRTVLNDVAGDPGRRRIFATTLKENINSIRLLGNLGFRFDKEIERENEKLLLYSLSIVIQHVTIKHTVEEVDPPHITSHFKTLQDWLFHICDSRKPKKSIATYRIGLFESPDDYVIFLVGLNTHTKGKNSYITRIGFKPSNMYFQLPKSEYENLSREQLIDQLASQLKDFITTEKFKTSFLAKAESINTDFGGQIWSK